MCKTYIPDRAVARVRGLALLPDHAGKLRLITTRSSPQPQYILRTTLSKYQDA